MTQYTKEKLLYLGHKSECYLVERPEMAALANLGVGVGCTCKRKLNKYEEAFQQRGYRIDDLLPECEAHSSQMMWNPQGKPECVVCAGNELAGLIIEI